MKNVLVMVPCDEEQRKILKNQFCSKYVMDFFETDGNIKENINFAQRISDADIIIGEPDLCDITKEKAPRLQWIQMTWAGTDKYTRNHGFPEDVCLTNASGAFGVIISEYVIAGILSLYRLLSTYRDQQRLHQWKNAGCEEHLYGKRALILGTGNIGTHIAKRLCAFECDVVGIRRSNIMPDYFNEIHTMEELSKELEKADIVISCMPNNSGTVGLMDKEHFGKMKNTALFVNVGRGLLLEEGAIEWALSNRKIAGAVLDVHREEPLYEKSPLWDMENVILTPHISGVSFGHSKITEKKIWDIVVDNLKRYDSGEELVNTVLFEEYR